MNNLFCDLRLRFPTSYEINVYNPEKNRITTTFNNYFKIHLNNKLMIWELDTLYSDEVEEREHITLDFVGRIIQVTVGKVQSPPPWEEVISKWGS